MNKTQLEIGTKIARAFFATRGNHSEVHVDEATLSALLAIAASAGAHVEKAKR